MTPIQRTVNWAFGIVFLVLGVLNAIFVHPVPGVFYLLLSCVYFPPSIAFIKKKLGFSVPFALTTTLALVILWGTLAVGELKEMVGL